MRRPEVTEYLHQQKGRLIHSLGCHIRRSRNRIRQMRRKNSGKARMDENLHMRRWMTEWGSHIPTLYRPAVDALLASRIGIGIVEGYYWQWGDAEAGCTEVLGRLQARTQPTHSEPRTPQRHVEPNTTKKPVSFRQMGRRSWYIIHNQLHNWAGEKQRDNTGTYKRLRQAFVTGLETLIPGSTPRPLTRIREGGGASDQELREYSLFAQYVARIEQMPREPQEGSTEYKPLMRMDFEKLSRRRQVLELQRTGMLVENGE